ncbi:MAG: acetylglutamate kinase [Candidatus Woesearchaeota archaeon]
MIIIKIGGGKDINIKGIANDLKNFLEKNPNEKIIVVHGANYFRDELAKKLNIEKKVLKSIKGFESVYSDEEAIDLILMSYSGLRNKRIVETFLQNNINAIGLSGIDGSLIIGQRNQGIRINENGKIKIIRDYSGKPKSVNVDLINLLLNNNYLPIISIPILDENNYAINTENDDVISLLNEKLNADLIISFIEASGFLEDRNNPDSLIKKVCYNDLEIMEQKVEGRMKRKIYAIKKLFESDSINSKLKVILADGRVENPLINALNENGTIITKN